MSRSYRILVLALLAFFSKTATAQHTAPASEQNEKIDSAISRLYQLHYWTGKSYSLTDDANRQAIIAFQKLNDLPRTGKLTDSTLARISGASIPEPREKLHEPHLEVDLDHQVLLVVDGSDQVNRILPVSTGSGQIFNDSGKGMQYARTPRGNFKVYYKLSGWKRSPLGLLFDPMYIQGGFAVHGSNDVPPHPASHGCIRLPMFAAPELFRVMPIGTPVIVYGENPKPR